MSYIGICVDVRTILGMDTGMMTAASASLLAYNATAAALHMTSNGEPTLMSGMYLFLMSAGENNISPTSELRAFIVRLTSDLHLLPVGAFVALGRVALCVHCFLWFTISSIAIIYWYFNPISLKRASRDSLLKKDQ